MREHQPISVAASRLRPIFEQARAAGIDLDALAKEFSLPPRLEDLQDDVALSLADYYRIQNRLMILTGDETLHLSSRQLMPGSIDFVLRHVGGCKSLGEVMQDIAETYNLLHGGAYNSVRKKPETLDYIIDDRSFPYAAAQTEEYIFFSIECVLIFLHCMLMTISPKADDAVRAVNIRRPWPGGDCGHLGYWEAPIKFGAPTYCLSFSREIAESEIAMPPEQARSANMVYQKIVDAVAGRRARRERLQSMTARVRDALSRAPSEQGDVAAELGVSVATLRRRLDEEGAKFRDLRRDALNETAKRLLASGHPVAGVAEEVGFSEFRAFSRAFKAWNGVTPKSWQERNAGKRAK